MTVAALRKDLRRCASKKKARILQSFFKTGPGEYGEGDTFIGVVVPDIRRISRRYGSLTLKDNSALLQSPIHEERLSALLILILQFERGSEVYKKVIYQHYVGHTRFINNWDLVDLSAAHIVGAFLMDKSKKPLSILAQSKLVWERRIAIVSTFYFIQRNKFQETLRIARMLLFDEHDLIHKAVGWMLREVGKRNLATEETFLKKHYKSMPRIMLRYAIERFPEAKRQRYLRGVI